MKTTDDGHGRSICLQCQSGYVNVSKEQNSKFAKNLVRRKLMLMVEKVTFFDGSEVRRYETFNQLEVR